MNEINIPRGTSKSVRIKIKHIDGTNYVHNDSDIVRLAVKNRLYQEDFDIEKEAVYDAETDSYVFEFTPEDTSEMYFLRYNYDIGLQTSDGKYFMIIPKSDFNVLPAVSKKR